MKIFGMKVIKAHGMKIPGGMALVAMNESTRTAEVAFMDGRLVKVSFEEWASWSKQAWTPEGRDDGEQGRRGARVRANRAHRGLVP